jgi:hypothetical protein
VVASGDVVVWETNVFSPPDGGPGCSPYTCWLLSYDAGRLRLSTAPEQLVRNGEAPEAVSFLA